MTPDQYCQQKAARSGSSFYYGFLFLPPDQRRAIIALYAFCREVDHPALIALGGFVVAAAGYVSSRGIPAAPPPVPDLTINLNPFSETWRNIAFARQKALKGLKFDPGEPDGAFGLKTTMAVWAYQALRGLPSDGVVRPLLEADILTAAPPAMLRPDLGPTHSEVDLDKQVLLVFRDGVLQLVTHVSTGSGRAYCEDGNCGDALTPPGEFAYQRRIAGWRVAPLGRLYNPVYFNGGIAVHGAGEVLGRGRARQVVRQGRPRGRERGLGRQDR